MQLDKYGRKFIERWEGIRLLAYQCSAGIWTIGLGSTRYSDGEPVRQGDRLKSEKEAWELFEHTLTPYEDAVSRGIKVPLNQNQFNALVSLVYNIGIGAFHASTLKRKLNAGDYDGVPAEFLRWDKAGGKPLLGLTNRRISEAGLFLLPLI